MDQKRQIRFPDQMQRAPQRPGAHRRKRRRQLAAAQPQPMERAGIELGLQPAEVRQHCFPGRRRQKMLPLQPQQTKLRGR